MSRFDVAVIGGGAAGLSAALVLTRARRRVVVLDDGRPRNAAAAHLQGFLSRDGLPPRELLALGRAEVASYGGALVDGHVSGVLRPSYGGFGVLLATGEPVHARRLLVTTGLRDEVLDLPGIAERWGRDLLHCPYCHGFEVRDQPLGVLGGTPGAVQHALLVRQWSHDVVLFTHTSVLNEAEREQLTARAIGIVDGAVERLVVEGDRLAGVALADGRVVRRTAVFVRPVLSGNHELARGLGAQIDDAGWPVVDGSGRSSVPGLWLAGNAVDPRGQLITAAGQGSAAAIALNADLTDEDVRDAVAGLRSGQPA